MTIAIVVTLRTEAEKNRGATGIGKREDGKIKRGIGGKAFPNDYNWTCNVCGYENRKWEPTCANCEHEASMKDS